MHLISKFNKRIRFSLCVIDIVGKYAGIAPLKDKKALQLPMLSKKTLKESNRKPNKIWVDKGS